MCTGCSPQCPQGALQLERSPCSHKPAKELLLMQTEPWQQQAVPRAGIALQQGVSGCCQGDRAWCQLWRCKGLQLPRGVEQHPLPEGREQRRGRRSIPASKQVTFGSLCNLHSYRSKSTPEGKQRESLVLEKHITFLQESFPAVTTPFWCGTGSTPCKVLLN